MNCQIEIKAIEIKAKETLKVKSITIDERSQSIIKKQVEVYLKNAFEVDFSSPKLCERTYPVSCVIDGNNLSAPNWAQLLVAIT